ncbi:MAG: cell division protein ZapA [Thermodesulfovibrionales bacterium]|nr:cell division protein ZapA [Thermodesulfovibrionales bacterium]
MKSTEVYILGQKYLLKGDASPEYMNELARFVDSRIREILKNSPNMPPLKAAILASLNISDELFKLKEREKDILKFVKERTDALEFIFSEE